LISNSGGCKDNEDGGWKEEGGKSLDLELLFLFIFFGFGDDCPGG
jgi:hypothetical protein